MNSQDIIRFNVYVIYEPSKKDSEMYRLEASNDGKNWEAITHNSAYLEYRNLIYIAERIVELVPNENGFKRVISENRSLDEHQGTLDGIVLRKSGCKLARSLSAEEKKELTKALDVAYSR